MSSIAEGLRKRDCTITLAKVSDTAFGDAFFHSILRDSSEQYLSVITDSDIQVFDLEGTELAVQLDSGASTYLGSVVSAKADLVAVNCDYTFVSNLQVLPKMETKTGLIRRVQQRMSAGSSRRTTARPTSSMSTAQRRRWKQLWRLLSPAAAHDREQDQL